MIIWRLNGYLMKKIKNSPLFGGEFLYEPLKFFKASLKQDVFLLIEEGYFYNRLINIIDKNEILELLDHVFLGGPYGT